MFKMKYDIASKYLTAPSSRRSGIKMNGVSFLVAHDTGNPGSTALGNVSYYERSRNDMEASAHLFVDDESIYECIPALTDTPEKAWHVVYNTPIDNRIFGCDANDYAIGVEMCYGGGMDIYASYERYKWVLAYACYMYQLDPASRITGHFILDPTRKTDPKNAFNILGITFDEFVQDVVKEYNDCIATSNAIQLGGVLDPDVATTVINTWIAKSIATTKDANLVGYYKWLANMLEAAKGVPLNPGVAETVINTWIGPSWFSTSDQGLKDRYHWLADQLRIAGGLPLN